MKRLLPILGVGVLIALLAFLNGSIHQNAQTDAEQQQAAQEAQKKAQEAQKPAPPKASPTAAGTATPTLPPEVTVGSPAQAKYKITVGWVYDESNQPRPQALADALKAVEDAAQASGGTASGEVVNLDAPAEEVSPAAQSVTGLGIQVNGVPLGPAVSPGTDGMTAVQVKTLLAAALGGKP